LRAASAGQGLDRGVDVWLIKKRQGETLSPCLVHHCAGFWSFKFECSNGKETQPTNKQTSSAEQSSSADLSSEEERERFFFSPLLEMFQK